MTYTTGDDDNAAGVLFSFAGFCFGIINAVCVVDIKRELRVQYPEKSNVALALQAFNTYMSTPYGLMMELVAAGLMVAGLIM